MSRAAFRVLADLSLIGWENLPSTIPLLLVTNHFSFIDPAAVIRATP
jgi:1-acyl-sn-glycerol-3-phosphate acyltransferase